VKQEGLSSCWAVRNSLLLSKKVFLYGLHFFFTLDEYRYSL
jgi:hypothetical protein